MPLSPLRFRLLVTSLLAVSFLGALDNTVVSTAIATVAGQLGALEHMSWIVVGYTLASTVLLPVLGKLGDRIGPRAVFLSSVAVFILSSVACGFANGIVWLIVARVIQGMSSAGLQLMSQTIIAEVTTPRQRPKFMAIIGAAFPIAILIGPVLGGIITDTWGWPWVFWINAPVGVVAFALALVAVPHIEPGRIGRFDFAGAIALTVGLVALVLAVSWVGDSAQAVATTVAFAVAAVALVVFFVIELRVEEPLVPLGWFRDRTVAAGHGHLGHRRHRPVLDHLVSADLLPDGVPHERHGLRARADRDGVRDAGQQPRDRLAGEPHRPLPRLPAHRHGARRRRPRARWRCFLPVHRCGRPRSRWPSSDSGPAPS